MASYLVETHKLVTGTPIATTNGGITCDYISLKNCHRVTIIANLLQAASHATALGVTEAKNVAALDAAAVTATMPNWKNANIATNDTLVKGTDAATVVATAGTNNQQLVLVIDPTKLSAGFDCIAATLSNSSEATNFASVVYICEMRYQSATPPSVVVE